MSDFMSDPFEALRVPVTPVDPDRRFAARLRARLERAVLDPRRDIMTTTTRLRQGDVGYASLWVPDLDRAAAFYESVLGWRYVPESGTQGRQVEGVTPPHGLWGGQHRTGLFVCYQVDDVPAALARVRGAGGTAAEPTRERYGLIAECQDDQGLHFAVYEDSGEGRAASVSPRPGELSYLTMEVPDAARARAFYSAVLGWEFTPGQVEDGWAVRIGGTEVRPMTGLWGGREYGGVTPMYVVDDIDAAVARVRAGGGTSTDPERQSYGISAECVDNQGAHFYLGQH